MMRLHALIYEAVFLIVALRGGVGQTSGVESLAIDREIQSGEESLRQGRYAEAEQHFERAEKLAVSPSAEINAGIAMSALQMGRFETARQREAKVLQLVSNDHARAEAHNIIGMAWLREATQSASAGQLRAAEDSFRQAVTLDPAFDMAYFNLGDTLLRQSRHAEGAAAFKKFVEVASKNVARGNDLPLAPQEPAPAFRVTDSEGRVFSPDALRGRFVLFDFWATWCPPCIRALPVIRELAHYFPPTQLTVISLDEDSPDERVWRNFITRENMDWTQVWDKGAETYYSFKLAPRPDLSLPRYVLLDRNNFVRRVYSGTDRLVSVAGEIVKTVESEPPEVPPWDCSMCAFQR